MPSAHIQFHANRVLAILVRVAECSHELGWFPTLWSKGLGVSDKTYPALNGTKRESLTNTVREDRAVHPLANSSGTAHPF